MENIYLRSEKYVNSILNQLSRLSENCAFDIYIFNINTSKELIMGETKVKFEKNTKFKWQNYNNNK